MSDTLISVAVDASVAERKLKALPERIRGRLRTVVVRDTQALADLVRSNLSGGVLNVRSGALLASIKSEMVENATSIFGRVYSRGVVYAAIQEYGGRTSAHTITAVNARSLHFFLGGGQEMFAKSVHHPGSNIPSRSYLRSALAAMRDRLVSDMTVAVRNPEWAGL